MEANRVPTPVLTLFGAIVRDVWQGRERERGESRRVLEKRQVGLQERKDTLEKAFLFDESINRDTYDRQRTKIEEDLSDIDRALESEARDLDVNRIVEFSQVVLCDPARFWKAADLEAKQRFQAILYPDCLTFGVDGFGTAVTPIVFEHLKAIQRRKPSLASPAGFEPALPP